MKQRIRMALNILAEYLDEDGKIDASRLTGDIRKLRAENAELKDILAQSKVCVQALNDEERENERLVKDAARYRWLKAHMTHTYGTWFFTHLDSTTGPTELDAAIDHAIEKEEGPSGM